MANNPRQRGSRPASARGDFTGNKKQALIAEHEAEVESRREELGITADRQQSIKDEGVVDLMSGTPRLEHPELEEDDAEQLNVVETPSGQVDVEPKPEPKPETGERLHSSQGASDMEIFELPEERVSASKQVLTADNSTAPTLIKVLYDLEDVTIGYGNTFNFKQDYRYKVPRWVAAHLEEKGVAIVLSLQPA